MIHRSVGEYPHMTYFTHHSLEKYKIQNFIKLVFIGMKKIHSNCMCSKEAPSNNIIVKFDSKMSGHSTVQSGSNKFLT